jgi:ubiquinone/menaquinone biosynthesis C-methylase UbiE
MPYDSANLIRYTRGNPVSRAHIRRFKRVIGDRLAPFAPRSVLDAGCGEGFTVNALAARFPGVSFTGVDADTDAIAFAQGHFGGPANFATANLYALPFADASFDAVVCSEVLEHLDAPDRALAEVLRVAGAVAVVTVPHEPYFDALLQLGIRLGFSPDPGHVNHWTFGQFSRFVRAQAPLARIEAHSLYLIATIPVVCVVPASDQ